jgi:hypothetical protein
MKQTLLEMVQRILQAVDGQMVESIEDTREAMQVAQCVKETYEHLLYTRDIKARSNLVQLHSVSDTDRPTTLLFNDNVCQIDVLKYYDEKCEKYHDLVWLDPTDFLNRSLDRNPNKDNVVNLTEPTSGVKYNVYNDRMPQYYTSFDDKTITLDAWDSRQSNTIMEEYTVCYGLILPEFKLEDTFVPDLAPQHFNLLLNSARVQAAYELNREQDTLVNDRARKELVTADKHAQRVRGIETTLWKNRPKSGRRI